MGKALERVVPCFLTIDSVMRKSDKHFDSNRLRYKALLIARNSGTVMYTSRVCETREQAETLGRRYLMKNSDRLSVESVTIHR